MRIIVPYNEILPKKTAHDVFVFHEAAAIAQLGVEVTLLTGRGSASMAALADFYGVDVPPTLSHHMLPIIRKNNRLGISWNLAFFWSTQRYLRDRGPHAVLFSVPKQALYHLRRRLPHLCYAYEAHELANYPHHPVCEKRRRQEATLVSLADWVVTTTSAIRDGLMAHGTHRCTIDTIPLATHKERLPPLSPSSTPRHLAYVGQLYPGQGVDRLLEAIASVPHLHLRIIGGDAASIDRLQKRAATPMLQQRVEFTGHLPPARLSTALEGIHAFVAPFEAVGRMPYVAHTKLYEYAAWGRPIIAPRLPSVEADFQESDGLIFFDPTSTISLRAALRQIADIDIFQQKQRQIEQWTPRFGWPARARALVDGLLKRIDNMG